jgi:glutathione S-transferase
MITLYGMPGTRAGRVRWVLEELGLPYREITLDRAAGEHRKPAFLKINPLGRVPAIVDGDAVLTETAAICLHLADSRPEKGLTPRAGSLERARMNQWLFLAQNELEAPLTVAFKLQHRVPEAERLPAVVPFCQRTFGEAAAVLEAHLAGRSNLLDSGFSVADANLACILAWAKGDGLLESLPNLDRYRQTHLARPAALRAFAGDEPS